MQTRVRLPVIVNHPLKGEKQRLAHIRDADRTIVHIGHDDTT